jgi:aminoglycoside phosphotransferase (APT) family kinase protein
MSSEAATPESEVESESDSSTVVYGHEPFETFKVRVLGLCQTVLAPSNAQISIERMHGGGFNRIIGVSVTTSESPTVSHYIVRIPRFEVAQLDRELAPLQLLRQRSTIKIPTVVAFDTTIHNVLESPYAIQTRIPGSSLFPAYPDMSYEMRCSIAKELGEFFSELHSIRSATPGRLTLSPDRGSLMIQSIYNTEMNETVIYEDGPAALTTSDMLCAIFERRKELAIAEGPNQSFRASFFDSFITTVSEMSALGVLDGNHYCLCHLDLEPRNILVSPLSPTQPQAITGILDWDSALFAPALMSCSPPMWLWAWNDEDEEDERLADIEPPTPELREIKQLFEHAAGPIYRRFAYGSQHRLARKLIRFATDGLQSNEDLTSADLLLAEWIEVRESLKLAAKATIAASSVNHSVTH